jgi:CHU_C Type IX secretion signal domain
MRKLFIALLLVLSAAFAVAQGQGDVWFFGDSVILDFSQGSPLVRTNTTMVSQEGSSALSTNEGSLLLYTNGWELFGSNDDVFANWVFPNAGYIGNQNQVQGNLLLPINDSIVYFCAASGSPTSGSENAMFYAKLNLRGNAGLGSIESVNTIMTDSITEHFAAIRDASTKGWWILSHKTRSNRFIKWHIDPIGNISKTVQNIGGIHPPQWVYYIGQMVFNPKGDRIAIASDLGLLEYYSFDRCTGDLNLLNTIQKPAVDSNGFFGISFSPSGKLLYASDGYWGFNWPSEGSRLFQYELDSLNILATERLIYRPWNCDSCRRTFGHHKLGPDGRIYVIQAIDDFHFEAQDTLWIIQNPDEIGLACNFEPNGILVRPGKTNYGLPNIPDYRIKPLVDQVAACGPDILLCKNDSVQLGVPDTSGTLTFQWWPATGLSDPTAAQPWASPSTSTTYHLMVVDTTVHSSCDNTIDSVRVTIVSPLLPRPVAFAGNDTVVCAGVPLQLGMADTSGGAWAFVWSPSGGLDDPFVSNPTASLNTSQQYILTAYRPEVVGFCQTDRDTVAVKVYDPSLLPLNPAGPDTVICIGDTLLLGVPTTAPVLNYTWQGNDLSNLSIPQPIAGSYYSFVASVTVHDTTVAGACGTVNDTVTVTIEHSIPTETPGEYEFCLGECFEMGVRPRPGYIYSWSPTTGLDDPNAATTVVHPASLGFSVYRLTIINPALQSANCREQVEYAELTANACHLQTFIAVNGDNTAETLDFGDHAGLFSLVVYDLNGRLVYADDNYWNDWSAANLAHGIYAYRVDVRSYPDEQGCPFSFVGRIVVVK